MGGRTDPGGGQRSPGVCMGGARTALTADVFHSAGAPEGPVPRLRPSRAQHLARARPHRRAGLWRRPGLHLCAGKAMR